MLSIYGIMTGTPWNATWDIFGLHIPFLCVTPVTQACVAMIFIQAMRRKLIHPANPPLSKNAAYLILIVVDCLMVGMIRGNLRIAGDGLERMSLFWTVHLVFSLLLALGITPGREALLSWIWRFRGKSPWLTDQLSGTRTANTGALVLFTLLGWAIGGLGLVGVDVLVNQPGNLMATPPISELDLFLVIGALITLPILLWSTILQLFAVLSGSSSPGVLIGVIVLMVMPLHIAGAWYENDFLLSMTISGQIATRFEDSHAVLPIWPSSLLYGGLFFLCLIALRQHLSYHERYIDLKLQQIGVNGVQPAASGPPEQDVVNS